ncbi:hypothetical protein Sjap_013453 [Stephania japonica]|uniref:Receptor-like serine/threonine-protein kinase n=1 Tax=Stephania japonica TaxID=461633 RepID=A0AAP0P1B6_9MAGN
MAIRATQLSFFVSILLISFHPYFASTTRNALQRGSSMSVEGGGSDLLTSPDNSFSCGFYPVGTNAYCFSIWFTDTKDKTVVWMANRDHPVNGQRSRVSFRRDGVMVLTDLDGSIVWSTNASSATDADTAQLLNGGNLVLKNPKGEILWQSFDYPTDTLLPAQTIDRHKKLISSKGKGSYYTGYYSFYFDNDNVLRLIYDGPEISSIYWPSRDRSVFESGRTYYNSSRIAVLDDLGSFFSSDLLNIYASDKGFGVKRRLTMDYDGNLRLYSLKKSSGSWVVSWEAISRPCDVHGLCGRNGICVFTPKHMCSCPPGHERVDPTDWSRGCRPKFTLACDQTQQLKFVELPHVDFYGNDLNYKRGMSLEDCKKWCSNECSCRGFSYKWGEAVCYIKDTLFNGYQSINFPGNAYLKLPSDYETSESAVLEGSEAMCNTNETEIITGYSHMNRSHRSRTTWLYLGCFAGAIGFIEILFIALGWWFLFRRRDTGNSVEDGYCAISSQFRKFAYSELKKETKNFTEELGRGGSAIVYKGVLEDDRVVAVKKLGDVIHGEGEFWAEVSTIGRINHMNLVRMWGFCSEKNHRLLVYELLEHGSLDKHLFSKFSSGNGSSNVEVGVLGWKERYKIALGAAKGLAYLHHECLEWVIHCDVKPENILLDSDFEPKIADFGLAKLTQRGGSGSEFTHIRGTKGYMAPEWAMNLPITAKVDVYSFGIVLMEIVKGIRLSSLVVEQGEEEEVPVAWFVKMIKKKIVSKDDSWIDHIIDPRLDGRFVKKQAVRMMEIALSCIEEERSKRPSMDSVVQGLQEVEEIEKNNAK